MPSATTDTTWLRTPTGITYVSMAMGVVMSGAKIALGLLVASQALVVEGLHSLSDLGSDFGVLAGLKVSRRPPDRTHLYGHRRVQTLVTLLIGSLMVGLAVWACYMAVRRWLNHEFPRYGYLPFSLMLVSAVGKEWLFRVMRAVGRKSGDSSVVANAWHSRSDAFASLATAIGVLGVAIGDRYWGDMGTWHWGFLDHVTALVLGGVLVTIGLKFMSQAAQELIDRAPAREVMESIAAAVRQTAGVRGYHAFRIRQLGGKLEMDVHVQVDPELTVAQGHDIATEVRNRVQRTDADVTSVIVHVEPAEK